MKQSLPIDIAIVNCVNQDEAIKTLNYCNRFFNFNNSFLFSDKNPYENKNTFVEIKKIQNINQYNNFMLQIGKYIKSDFLLVVQDDGHIVNSNKWSENFLNYDYVGAPWPNSRKWNKRWKGHNRELIINNLTNNRVGNGGFSLRSKKFLEFSAQYVNCDEYAEDVFLCILKYEEAIKNGIKFAPYDIASQFSMEVPQGGFRKRKEKKNKNFNVENHFGWHGKRFKNSSDLLDLKFS